MDKSQQSILTFVLGLTVAMLVVFIALTNMFGSTNIVGIGCKKFLGGQKISLSQKNKEPEAEYLTSNVRILCWIMTSPKNLQRRAVHVRDTWARRCNITLFMSSRTNKKFPTIGLNVSEGWKHLTAKTVKAFRYVYDHYFEDADWFIKADDDTYVIVENLRYFLSNQDKDSPIYFGHHLGAFIRQGFFSGGAGYVLSKEALRIFARRGNDPKLCQEDGGAEDLRFGRCMENLGVKAGNSTDSLGRSRFHCFGPETHLKGDYPSWYYKWDTNGAKKGKDNISNYAISFHHVRPQKMHELELFLYHLRPRGFPSQNRDEAALIE